MKRERPGPLRAKCAENFHSLEIILGKLLLVSCIRPLDLEALDAMRPLGARGTGGKLPSLPPLPALLAPCIFSLAPPLYCWYYFMTHPDIEAFWALLIRVPRGGSGGTFSPGPQVLGLHKIRSSVICDC